MNIETSIHQTEKTENRISYIHITLADTLLEVPDFQSHFDLLHASDYLDLSNKLVGSSVFSYLGQKMMNDNEFVNIVEGGKNSCAYFVSNVLAYYRLIGHGSATVSSLKQQLERSTQFSHHMYSESSQIPEGAIVFWHVEDTEDPTISPDHVGFSLGNGMAISNSSYSKQIAMHPLFGTKNNMTPTSYYILHA